MVKDKHECEVCGAEKEPEDLYDIEGTVACYDCADELEKKLLDDMKSSIEDAVADSKRDRKHVDKKRVDESTNIEEPTDFFSRFLSNLDLKEQAKKDRDGRALEEMSHGRRRQLRSQDAPGNKIKFGVK